MTDCIHNIPPDLVKAYQEALYVIHGVDGDIRLRVGQPSLELIPLMKRYVVKSAAFLTAFNPHSILTAAEVNVHNHNALVADIRSLGLELIQGEGEDPFNLWPMELSVLVLGISHGNAEILADRYRQNAFLWIECDDCLVSLNLRYPVRRLHS